PGSAVRNCGSLTSRSHPGEVRRYQTSAGPLTRKVITKSSTPSLSRSTIRLPVCCVDSPGTGRSPFLLVACCHFTSVACDKGSGSDKRKRNATSRAEDDNPDFMARGCQKLAKNASSQFTPPKIPPTLARR